MQKPLSLEAALTQVRFYTGLDLDADDIRSLYQILKVDRKDTAIFKYLKKANHPLGVKLEHIPGDKNWWDKVRADIAKADDDPYPEEASGSHQYHVAHDRNAAIWWLEHWILPVLEDPGQYPVEQAIAAVEDEVQQEADTEPLPSDDYDARTRVIKQAVARRGQPKFRSKLMKAYSGRCAVTGYEAEAALEAAHLRPYRGPESNALSNGLLLRADIHTLLDLGLLAFNPQTREVVVSQLLAGTQYASLSGTPWLSRHWNRSGRARTPSIRSGGTSRKLNQIERHSVVRRARLLTPSERVRVHRWTPDRLLCGFPIIGSWWDIDDH